MKQQWAEYKRTSIAPAMRRIAPRQPQAPGRDAYLLGNSLGMNAETLFDDATGRHQPVADAVDSEESVSDDDADVTEENESSQTSQKPKLTTAAAISAGTLDQHVFFNGSINAND